MIKVSVDLIFKNKKILKFGYELLASQIMPLIIDGSATELQYFFIFFLNNNLDFSVLQTFDNETHYLITMIGADTISKWGCHKA